ncbi:hypothetical protein BJ875DRAFT_479866 [Amylocarpus encephaloides]|uniref:Uncharacterized protein n=1 Tax=Amylocarpus encephaloides TaxID=45428 RepID=A0A9P7YTV4_9HELO|nr:hypothetical protein BJ875DRAFT_479866 [Amylocarpus encephaloides]
MSEGNSQRDQDLEDNIAPTPAVGIAFTATYGTISIRHPDGSFEDIGRIDASEQYISMIQRLSSPEKKHLSPPYSSFENRFHDVPRQYLRGLKKRLGLAASSDVKILAEMLRPLLDLHPIEGKFPTVVMSYPPIVALYNEDIVDAAAYLKVGAQDGAHFYQPREIVAAFAGYGRGLCSHPDDRRRCLDELIALPDAQVLHVEYTKKAMIFHGATLRGAQDFAEGDLDARALYDMGSEQRYKEDFLSMVQEYVTEFVTEWQKYSPHTPDMVLIMTGDEENVRDEAVKEAIRHAMETVGMSSVETLDSMPEYIAARGAAELCERGKGFYSEGKVHPGL